MSFPSAVNVNRLVHGTVVSWRVAEGRIRYGIIDGYPWCSDHAVISGTTGVLVAGPCHCIPNTVRVIPFGTQGTSSSILTVNVSNLVIDIEPPDTGKWAG